MNNNRASLGRPFSFKTKSVTMKEKAIYMRISTKKDRGDQSDERQRFAIPDDVTREYFDEASGFRVPFDQRKDAKRLMSDTEAGKIGHLYVSEASRFSRNVGDAFRHLLFFMDHSVQITFLESKTDVFIVKPDGDFDFDLDRIFPVLASFYLSQKDSQLKSYAIRSGITAIKKGAPQKKGSKIVEDLERQEAIKKVFQERPWTALKTIRTDFGCSYYTAKKIRDQVFGSVSSN